MSENERYIGGNPGAPQYDVLIDGGLVLIRQEREDSDHEIILWSEQIDELIGWLQKAKEKSQP